MSFFKSLTKLKAETEANKARNKKAKKAIEIIANYLISTDISCLMHIDGYAKKAGKNMKMMHLCDVLASGWD